MAVVAVAQPSEERGSASSISNLAEQEQEQHSQRGMRMRDEHTSQQSALGVGHSADARAVRASSASHLPLATSRSRDASIPFPLSASSSHLPEPQTIVNGNGYLSAATAAQMHPKTSMSSSTNTSSSNADALHVQRTYQRIAEVGGIPGDGFVTGVELTRERRTEASISGYLSPLMASTSSAAARLQPPSMMRKESAPAFSNLLTVSNNSNAYAFTSSHDEAAGAYEPASVASSRKPSLVPSARSVEDEANELKLLETVDRYGFFAPTYPQHARLVLLSQRECQNLPPENALKASTSGRRKSGSGAAGKRPSLNENLESPYIHVPQASGSNRATPDGSRRSSMQPNGNGSPVTTSSRSRRSFSASRPHPAALIPDNVSHSSSYIAKEASRTDKWYNEMLQPAARDPGGNVISWQLSQKMADEKLLLRRVCKGVPDRWRAAAWEAMLHRRRRLTATTFSDDAALARKFYDSILEPCEHDVQIDLDVPRTISGHLYFHTRYGLGQRSLFNVLHAFALYCPQCGYCQGMGSLAATFLCYLPPEKSYAAMVTLHDTYDMHTIFAPGFPGMLECFYVQEKLVELFMPDVSAVFEKNFITISSFATKWYITLFANAISFSTQLRIWDAFLLEGKDVLILVSTAIIWVLRHHFTSPQADFESILSLLSSFFVPEDEDALLRLVRKMLKRPDLRVQMRKWAAEHRQQVAKEQS